MNAIAEKPKVSVSCQHCAATCEVRELKDGSPALAPGWLRLGESLICPRCRAERFCMRAIVQPVWSAEPNEGEGTDKAWFRLLDALRTSFRQAAQVGNFTIRELAKADTGAATKTAEGKVKLPKIGDTKHLYGAARELAPDLDSQSVGSVIQRARAKYADARWDTRVTFQVSLPSYRIPAPIPIPDKDAHVSFTADDQLWLSLRISGQRFNLRLARGSRFRRAHGALKKGLAGEARFGEVLLTARCENGKLRDVKARFSMELPKEPGVRENTMVVKTCKDRLLTVLVEGREHLWNLNEDQAKSIIVAHKARLQRLSDDDKFERRHPRKRHGGIQAVRDRISKVYADRMSDFCHKAAKMVIGFAQRNRVATIQYNDTERFMDEFPWFMLLARFKEKAAHAGITFEKVEPSEEKAAE